jgi:hypothetical protein
MDTGKDDILIPLFRAQKGFEGRSAFFCWTVTVKAGGRHHKGHLIADAEQKTFGIRLTDNKPENLNPTGGVVAQMRKHARAPTIGRILRDGESGDIWCELYTDSASSPSFWLQLAAGHPPELRLIDRERTIHIRKSSQGTFTKKKTWDGTLPDPADARFQLLNQELLDGFLPAVTPGDDKDEAASAGAEDENSAAGDEAATLLPDYQREARDRVARRLKTMQKSPAKNQSPAALRAELTLTERQAELTKAWLHTIREGDHELRLGFLTDVPPELQVIALDPELSPGANLDGMFGRVRKLKKAISVGSRMAEDLEAETRSLATDLARLRAGPLDLRSVQDILQRHKLAAKKQEAKKTESPAHAPWRTFFFRDGSREIRFFIGKSAADNDELCKKAKSNDLWLHAVGVTGSHVIIPAKELAGGTPPDLIRAAGILALHFSKLRDDQRGEVYLSKRQFIRKQKGMAPGLWTVDKADSIFVRYDQNDLQKALDLQTRQTADADGREPR